MSLSKTRNVRRIITAAFAAAVLPFSVAACTEDDDDPTIIEEEDGDSPDETVTESETPDETESP